MAVVIALPFSFTVSGGISNTNLVSKTWSDRVLGVIFTLPSERVMRPNFGSLAKASVFEPEGAVREYVSRTVTSAFNQYLPELSLTSIKVVKEYGELGDEGFVIYVDYVLPNKQTDSVTAKIGLFTRAGELIQEIQ
jgi:phage baseplate assembly protein W